MTLILSGANNTGFQGLLRVTAGTVRTDAAGALNGASVMVHRGGTLNLNGHSSTIGSLTIWGDVSSPALTGAVVTTGAGTLTLGGTLAYIPDSSASAATVISGTIDLGAATRTVSVGTTSAINSEFQTTANITAPTGVGLTKVGDGHWLAKGGTWSFSGPTTISNGSIGVGAANVFSPLSTVTLTGTGSLGLGYTPTVGAAYLSYDQTLGGLSSSVSTSVVSLGGATLTVGGNGESTTFAGGIFGSGKIVKTGSGTLSLTATANGFSGGLEIQQGTVAVATNAGLGSLSSPDVVVRAGGQLRFLESVTTFRTFDLIGGGALSVDSGKTVGYSGTVNGGILRGLGTHAFGSTSVVNGPTVLAGTNVSLSSSATVVNATMGGNLTASGTGTKTLDGGSLTSSGTVLVNNSAVLAVNQWASNGVITVAGGVTPGRLNNTLTPLVLGGGSRTYVGSVAQRGGTIHLGGQNLELNGGLLVNNGDFVALNNGGIQGGIVNVNYGSLAKGTGYYEAVNVTDGGKFAPGNSITNTTSGSLTLNSGSTYEFEINRAAGTAGGGGGNPPVGWDLLNLVVAFNVNSTAGSPAIIQLVSRNAADTGGGTLPDFNSSQPNSWLAFRVNAGGTINGFATDKFVVDTTAFSNLPNPAGVGTFSMNLIGNDVFLEYAPVPEPGSILLGIGVLGVGARALRRRPNPARVGA